MSKKRKADEKSVQMTPGQLKVSKKAHQHKRRADNIAARAKKAATPPQLPQPKKAKSKKAKGMSEGKHKKQKVAHTNPNSNENGNPLGNSNRYIPPILDESPGDIGTNADFVPLTFDDDSILSRISPPITHMRQKRRRSASPVRLPRGAQLLRRETRSMLEADAKMTKAPWITRPQGYQHTDFREVPDMLTAECIDFVEYLTPTPEEHQLRKWAVQRISALINGIWPGSQVHCFGSFQTLLYLPTGDLDIVIINESLIGHRTELRKLARELQRTRVGLEISVIANAKVPIVKFTEAVTRINVDISFNKSNGITAVDVVKHFLAEYPVARYLIVILKYFLQLRNLHEPFNGGVGSYSLICMVVCFLQMHPRLKSGDINAESNLGTLLIEFFELYGKHFNYDNVGISVARGGSYFSKSARGWASDKVPFLLSIEDPQDPTNDVAKASRNIINVRQAFVGAFEMLTAAIYTQNNAFYARDRGHFFDMGSSSLPGAAEATSLLVKIVPIKPKIHQRRSLLAQIFEDGKMQKAMERDAFARNLHLDQDIADPRELVRLMAMQRSTRTARGIVEESSQPSSLHQPEVVYVADEEDDIETTVTPKQVVVDVDSSPTSSNTTNAMRRAFWQAKGGVDTELRSSASDEEPPDETVEDDIKQKGQGRHVSGTPKRKV